MIRLVVLITALAVAGCTTPQSAPASKFPDVANSSFADASGTRTIQLSVRVATTPAQAYAAFATADGWKSWAVPAVFGEPRVGGFIETSYNPAGKAGDPANIQQEFLALIPDRLVAFRTTRAPPGFPNAELYYKTLTVVEFAPEGRATKVTLYHTGFASGAGFDQLHAMFTEGDAYSLQQLAKRFETGPVDWSKATPPN